MKHVQNTAAAQMLLVSAGNYTLEAMRQLGDPLTIMAVFTGSLASTIGAIADEDWQKIFEASQGECQHKAQGCTCSETTRQLWRSLDDMRGRALGKINPDGSPVASKPTASPKSTGGHRVH